MENGDAQKHAINVTQNRSKTPFRKQCDKISPSDHIGNPKTWTINSWNSRWCSGHNYRSSVVDPSQYDNTRGAWLTQEGCTITERKGGVGATQTHCTTAQSQDTQEILQH